MVNVKSHVNARAHTKDKIPEDPSKPYIFCPGENLHAKITQTKSSNLTKLLTTCVTSTLAKMEIAPQY